MSIPVGFPVFANLPAGQNPLSVFDAAFAIVFAGTWIPTNFPAKSIPQAALADSGAVAGSYGDSTHIPAITVSASGVITAVGSIPTQVDLSTAINNLSVNRLNGGAAASAATFWRGDGTWAAPAGAGTVTNTAGNLTASAIMVGNGGADAKVLASLGTTTTVLHGNAAGLPTFGAVSLTADVTGNLPVTNLAGGAGANATSFWRGDGSWATPAGSGNVSAAGNLADKALVLGSGGSTGVATALGLTTDGVSKLNLGVAGASVGSAVFANATSGTITLSPVTGALGAVTLSLPAATDTLVGKATTDVLTNKTITGNTAANLISGAGQLTLNTAGTATVPNATDTLVGKATTDTLTNKRVTKRVFSEASNATSTPNADSYDQHIVTALAAADAFAAPTGTPTDGQPFIIRIKDNGTARALTWNGIYRAVGVVLPATTVISKTLYLGMIFNNADTKWDVLAVNLEG